MFGFGWTEILVAAIVLVACISVGSRFAGRAASGPALVLRRFRVRDDATEGTVIEISGRPEGIVSWLLTTVGLDTETSMLVSPNVAEFKRSGFFEQSRSAVPLSQVASTTCGYVKPAVALVLALGLGFVGVFTVSGSSLLGTILLVMAAISAIAYFLGKTIALSVETGGGSRFGLRFKRSVIEGVNADMPAALNAVALLNRLTLNATKTPIVVA